MLASFKSSTSISLRVHRQTSIRGALQAMLVPVGPSLLSAVQGERIEHTHVDAYWSHGRISRGLVSETSKWLNDRSLQQFWGHQARRRGSLGV